MIQSNPGDVKILQAKLRSSFNDSELDITPQIKSVSVFESLFDPVTMCELLIEDGIELYKTFPIIGEEVFTLSFKTPGNDDVTTYEFDMFKTVSKSDTPFKKTSSYVLRGISREGMTALKKGTINDAFNAPAHEIVQKILTEKLGTTKTIRSEKTRGFNQLIIPNLYCFQAIDYLSQRSVSAETAGSAFVFFENQHGFHFRTIESMIKNQRNTYGTKEFTFDNSPTISGQESTRLMYRNILVLDKINTVSNIRSIAEGGYKNVVKSFDVITKSFDTSEFSITKNGQFVSSDNNSTLKNSSKFISGIENQQDAKAKHVFVPKDSSKVHEFLPDALGGKLAFNALFSDSPIFNVLVYGDSTLAVGETVKLNLLTHSGLSTKPSDEQYYSGMYLISGLRHLISPGADSNHYVAMQLVKMGYAG